MVYILLADGFEEVEAIEPADIMKRSGIDVKTVSVTDKKLVTGAHGIPVTADMFIDEVKKDNMELLMLPGGAGHVLLDSSDAVHALIDYAFENEIYLAAICASPSVLGKKGILKGKNATCFPGFEKYLDGANVLSDKAVTDGKIITGKGAGAAADFGFAIVKALKDAETAAVVKAQMQY